jgi:uncharacterized cupredoxin-like copper-binding protein
MVSPVTHRASLALCLVFLAGAHPLGAIAHSASLAGEPGDPGRPARAVEIVMSDGAGGMRFAPDRVEVRRGEQVRFVISNSGSLTHEFFLGTLGENREHAAMMARMPDMRHDDPNARTIAPRRSSSILWRFSDTGEYEFACLIPGHYQAGMHGVVIVR